MTPAAHRVRASALSTYRLCKRKWAFGALDGLDRSNAAAERGTAIHAILAAWLQDGTPPDLGTEYGRVAAAGVRHLPPPGICEAEVPVEVGDLWRGTSDARYLEAGRAVVIDHKTTSDLRWAKTEDELRTDPQALVYAAAALDRWPEVSEVELRWVYYEVRDREPRSRRVSVRLDVFDVEAGLRSIEPESREMQSLLMRSIPALSVEPTPTACAAMGGCPYVEPCGLSSSDRLRAKMAMAELKQEVREENKVPTLAEKFAARRASAGNSEQAAAATSVLGSGPVVAAAEPEPRIDVAAAAQGMHHTAYAATLEAIALVLRAGLEACEREMRRNR